MGYLGLHKQPLFNIFKKSSQRKSSSSEAIYERMNKVLQKYAFAFKKKQNLKFQNKLPVFHEILTPKQIF